MDNKISKRIISRLPYSKPFLFVDEILHVDEESVKGTYLFSPELDFYKGHFKDKPVTPGVILTECMAQIGVVCLGVFLTEDSSIGKDQQISLTSSETEYFKPVFPGEKVLVLSKKIYFRFGKLKCAVEMLNAREEIVAKGIIAGMVENPKLLT